MYFIWIIKQFLSQPFTFCFPVLLPISPGSKAAEENKQLCGRYLVTSWVTNPHPRTKLLPKNMVLLVFSNTALPLLFHYSTDSNKDHQTNLISVRNCSLLTPKTQWSVLSLPTTSETKDLTYIRESMRRGKWQARGTTTFSSYGALWIPLTTDPQLEASSLLKFFLLSFQPLLVY